MSRAHRALTGLLALLFAAACNRCAPASAPPAASGADALVETASQPASGSPTITGVSPNVASNQTDVPLFVFGSSLQAAKKLHLGSPFNRDVPLQVVDATFATARLPRDLAMPPEFAEVKVPLALADEDGMLLGEGVDLTVVNDQGFPELQAMAATPDLLYAFVPSPTSDEVLRLDTTTGAVSGMQVGDGPSAIATTKVEGAEQVLVAHRFAKELRVITARPDSKGQHSQRTLPAPDHVGAILAVDGVAYLLEQRAHTVVAVDLKDGHVVWLSAPVPGATDLALTLGKVNVLRRSAASPGTFLDRATGERREAGFLPLPGGGDPSSLPAVVPAAVLDEWRTRMYVAAPEAGLVRVLDLKAPKSVDRARSSIAVPSPWALVLSQDGQSMLVLERFAGKIARLDLRGDQPKLVKELPVIDPPAQAERREGQTLFFAGKQSCASCHPEGQGSAGTRDLTAALASPAHASATKDPQALKRLTAYVRGLTAPPSPWRDANGGLLPQIPLAADRAGVPEQGRKLFLAKCTGGSRAPAALFDEARRTPPSKALERCRDLDAQSRADVEAFLLSL